MTPLHTYCKPLTIGASNAVIIQALKVFNPVLAMWWLLTESTENGALHSAMGISHVDFLDLLSVCVVAVTGHEDVHADAGAGGGHAEVAPAGGLHPGGRRPHRDAGPDGPRRRHPGRAFHRCVTHLVLQDLPGVICDAKLHKGCSH